MHLWHFLCKKNIHTNILQVSFGVILWSFSSLRDCEQFDFVTERCQPWFNLTWHPRFLQVNTKALSSMPLLIVSTYHWKSIHVFLLRYSTLTSGCPVIYSAIACLWSINTQGIVTFTYNPHVGRGTSNKWKRSKQVHYTEHKHRMFSWDIGQIGNMR